MADEERLLSVGYLFQHHPTTDPEKHVIPYTYGYNPLYDPGTALRQGTVFPELDDHWRNVAEHLEASGYAWHRPAFRTEGSSDE